MDRNTYDRNRLIGSIIVLFVYLLYHFPWQTITISVMLCVGYFIIRNIHSNTIENRSKEIRRMAALEDVRIYLAPYTDIWRNLRISNKYCSLRLGYDGQTITAKEIIGSGRYFKIVKSNVHSMSDLWNMMCHHFNHNTTFDGLIEQCMTFQAEIKVNNGNSSSIQKAELSSLTAEKKESSDDIKVDTISLENQNKPKEKLDVNNASEVELTALPGVSIVMAKKLIKKREEIGGFKTVNDVCLFLHLKPHMQNQLEELICVKKMKGSVNIKRYDERKLDL